MVHSEDIAVRVLCRIECRHLNGQIVLSIQLSLAVAKELPVIVMPIEATSNGG